MNIWRSLTVARMAGLGQLSAVLYIYKTKIKARSCSFPCEHWDIQGLSISYFESRTTMFPSSVQGHNS